MNSSTLFSPWRLGPYDLRHRIVMPPLTRLRSDEPHNAPGPLNAQYYGQRASEGGLIIAEATWVSPGGKALPGAPGVSTDHQVEGWAAVTKAVHAKGGVIFLQLWHSGRIGHSSVRPGGGRPVAPSAVAARGLTLNARGERVPFETPRALETHEIASLVEEFRQGARNALVAGFDGVELHGANGYLFEQFLQSRTNRRSDAYGGAFENRARFLLEAASAVADVCGPERVGVRLSPYGVASDSGEDEPFPLYLHTIQALAKLNIADLHLIEPRSSGIGSAEVDRSDQPLAAALFRPHWPSALISAGGYDQANANTMIAGGHADAIGFGRAFIANPDLPRRLFEGAPLNTYDRASFYTKGPRGYTDYPAGQPGAPAI
jgi:N-ethylmaleimide reductase